MLPWFLTLLSDPTREKYWTFCLNWLGEVQLDGQPTSPASQHFNARNYALQLALEVLVQIAAITALAGGRLLIWRSLPKPLIWYIQLGFTALAAFDSTYLMVDSLLREISLFYGLKYGVFFLRRLCYSNHSHAESKRKERPLGSAYCCCPGIHRMVCFCISKQTTTDHLKSFGFKSNPA